MKCIKLNYIIYSGVFGLLSIILWFGLILPSFANESITSTASVVVPVSCTLSAGGGEYSLTMNSNSITEQTANTITTSCNDVSGYAIYAVGYSNDDYSGANTDLIASLGSNYNIKTDGTGTYGSSWQMKLTDPINTAIVTGFDSYHNIPGSFTKVASYTNNVAVSSFTPKYQISISSSQPAGTYVGKVKYVLIHPNTASVPGAYTIIYNNNGGSGTMANDTAYTFEPFTLPASTFTIVGGYRFAGWCMVQDQSQSPQTACNSTLYVAGDVVMGLASAGETVNLYAIWEELPLLYNLVARVSNGTQTFADLQAPITINNSGVYEYDVNVFGTSSDAANTSKIYYYRGILDSNLDGTSSTYGSNGDGVLWPNYVKLGNVCWRIVRTTGSGGVKMIYNGLYTSGSTANSCANATTSAQIAARAFGLKGNSAQSTHWYRNINRVGYTFNNDVDLQDSTTSTDVNTVFGSNSNYTTTNTANSNIKNYIENTWFTSTNGIRVYESILEPSAGYCNDRTAFSDEAGTTTLSNIPPYTASGDEMFFGAYTRNGYEDAKLSLACPSSRSIVDLYTTTSATNGNKQLNKPVALLTTDEAALAGSGYNLSAGGAVESTFSSNYNYNSYLRSGADFWLLSPSVRPKNGYAAGFVLTTKGHISYSYVGYSFGVRPVISLVSGTRISSGSGTAIDPWVISAP